MSDGTGAMVTEERTLADGGLSLHSKRGGKSVDAVYRMLRAAFPLFLVRVQESQGACDVERCERHSSCRGSSLRDSGNVSSQFGCGGHYI